MSPPHLLPPYIPRIFPRQVVLGLTAGVAFISATQSWLQSFGDVGFHDARGADARKLILIIGIMTAHAFGEGAGVGVSFSGRRGWSEGLLVTLAIGVHNIPEGLAVSTVMAASGLPPRACLLWSVATSLPQPLIAVPAYAFVETFSALLPLGARLPRPSAPRAPTPTPTPHSPRPKTLKP